MSWDVKGLKEPLRTSEEAIEERSGPMREETGSLTAAAAAVDAKRAMENFMACN